MLVAAAAAEGEDPTAHPSVAADNVAMAAVAVLAMSTPESELLSTCFFR